MLLNKLAYLRGDSEDKAALNEAIVGAVERSVKSHPLRLEMTDAELNRRIQFCVSKALELYEDYHWTVAKIAAHIETALRCHLLKLTWAPELVGDFWEVPE